MFHNFPEGPTMRIRTSVLTRPSTLNIAVTQLALPRSPPKVDPSYERAPFAPLEHNRIGITPDHTFMGLPHLLNTRDIRGDYPVWCADGRMPTKTP